MKKTDNEVKENEECITRSTLQLKHTTLKPFYNATRYSEVMGTANQIKFPLKSPLTYMHSKPHFNTVKLTF